MKKAKANNQDVQKVSKKAVGEELVTTDFALQVVKHVIQENLAKRESVVCSPASIDAILSILAIGAKNSTLEQLLALLGHGNVGELNASASKFAAVFNGKHDEDVGSDREDGNSDEKVEGSDGNADAPEISLVNGLWLDRRFSLKPAFQKILREVHNTDARVADFVNKADQVVQEANSWAAQESKGLIKEVLTPEDINKDTILFLANALYFKGTWHSAFDPKLTKDMDFSLLNGEKVEVPMMNQRGKYFDYGTFDDCQVLKMPYKIDYKAPWKTFSMYVFLPNEKDGLPNLIKNIKFDSTLFNGKFKLDSEKISYLSLPKFKFECHVALKKSMIQLGLKLPFQANCTDLSEITDNIEPVYVSHIDQKCFIETNELGTVAVAFTRKRYAAGGIMVQTNFVADHPFMFIIREDDSAAILFTGIVLDPR